IDFHGELLTYRQLNAKANQLARHLRALGIGSEQIVGVCLDRTPALVVALLGILKAGAAYLPLDPGYPPARLAWMINDSQLKLIITEHKRKDLLGLLNDCGAQRLEIDREWPSIARQPESDPAVEVEGEDLAYVIYTSGSTGRPKGVLLEHCGLTNMAQMHARRFGINEKSRVLQFASISFDASVWEMMMALASGARLCLMNAEKM